MTFLDMDKMKAKGSVDEIKKQFGIGYNLIINHNEPLDGKFEHEEHGRVEHGNVEHGEVEPGRARSSLARSRTSRKLFSAEELDAMIK